MRRISQGAGIPARSRPRLPDYDVRYIVTDQIIREVKDGVELDVTLWKTNIDPSRFGQD